MDEHEIFPAPTPPPVPEDAAPPTAPTRRADTVLVAAVATAALLVAGGGLGYLVGTHRTAPGASLSGNQGASSSELLPGQGDQFGGPGAGAGDGSGGQLGGQLGGQFGGQPYDGQQGGQLPTAPDGAGSGTSSRDTTATASGSQLTGLVRIVSTMKYAEGKAAGTGMVLTSNGEVITNHHVVQGSTSVKATVMSTGKTYTATVVGTDAAADVAVLQLQDASGLQTITPDQDAVATGDDVTAVGDGNGTVDHLSAATGEVMATDQSITTQGDGTASGESLAGLIEISSDVVSGYSGGATYDAQGEVLGMTTAASKGGSDVVGYAIPIATVLKVADDLESGVHSNAYSYGHPAFLGVGLAEGTTVERVYAGTPADKAGIVAGDSITRFGGKAVSTAAQLQAAVAAHQPGDSVSVSWTDAEGTSHTAPVTLVAGPVK